MTTAAVHPVDEVLPGVRQAQLVLRQRVGATRERGARIVDEVVRRAAAGAVLLVPQPRIAARRVKPLALARL